MQMSMVLAELHDENITQACLLLATVYLEPMEKTLATKHASHKHEIVNWQR